jgi:hypothetical protein
VFGHGEGQSDIEARADVNASREFGLHGRGDAEPPLRDLIEARAARHRQ